MLLPKLAVSVRNLIFGSVTLVQMYIHAYTFTSNLQIDTTFNYSSSHYSHCV